MSELFPLEIENDFSLHRILMTTNEQLTRIVVLLIQSVAMWLLSSPSTSDTSSIIASRHCKLADVNASVKGTNLIELHSKWWRN